ncbi:MAG: cobalt-precorrin-5B (C(1))-methyltransferase [Bacteroidaceae bacterium]|nr:cobalt-precorrin-5B (C(1))-methyltransferase [Bacteroidaceae bacterium]
MVLVFGGTTEGRIAVKKLEESGNAYYYSTRGDEQEIVLHHGIRLQGAMNGEQLKVFCQEHGIRLLIDAGHPFAVQLHQTVADTATELGIPAIRFERIFPPRDPSVIWCSDYDDAIRKIREQGVRTLLALTGVQTISKLKPLIAQGVDCYFRILNRESSRKIAHDQGIADDHLLFYDIEHTESLTTHVADAMITKESGLTGGYVEKVKAAQEQGMKVFAICHPATLPAFHVVNGEHGLRRMVEKLLPEFYPLHSGITTGTCATAAAIAALTLQPTPSVPVILPNGETIHVEVHYGNGYAYVLKDSGDDPDVTKGIEIRASVEILPSDTPLTEEDLADDDGIEPRILIRGGEGIGKITLPGFDYPVGSSAINKVPRQMIRQNLRHLITNSSSLNTQSPMPHGKCSMFNVQHSTFLVTLSVPEGSEIARRTFNPRLGIVGGISIVGISGIIQPFSIEGFISSIKKCMQVAKASGCDEVVINSGAKSENYLKARFPQLPPQVFVQYGNFIGETLQVAAELNIPKVTLGVMIGKAVKLAEGHLDTHSHKVVMNKEFIRQLMTEAHCSDSSLQVADTLNMARDLWALLPEGEMHRLASVILRHCHQHCAPLLPQGTLHVILVSEDGNIYG